jgi:hypothetical protein
VSRDRKAKKENMKEEVANGRRKRRLEGREGNREKDVK